MVIFADVKKLTYAPYATQQANRLLIISNWISFDILIVFFYIWTKCFPLPVPNGFARPPHCPQHALPPSHTKHRCARGAIYVTPGQDRLYGDPFPESMAIRQAEETTGERAPHPSWSGHQLFGSRRLEPPGVVKNTTRPILDESRLQGFFSFARGRNEKVTFCGSSDWDLGLPGECSGHEFYEMI